MRITVVTPVLNCAQYVEEAIESVISQAGDFEIEYLVADGGSTDGTYEIVEAFKRRLHEGETVPRCNGIAFTCWQRKDRSMYDALNHAFGTATGDVHCWINADDKYEPGAFKVVSSIFKQFSDVRWVKGICHYLDENSNVVRRGNAYLYDQDLLRRGIYGRLSTFVQQHGCFWRASLFDREFPADIRLAGDYVLWAWFPEKAPLYSFNQDVSYFRMRAGQLSKQFDEYTREMERVKRIPPAFSFLLSKLFRYRDKYGRYSIAARCLDMLLTRGRGYRFIDVREVPFRRFERYFEGMPTEEGV